MWHREPLNQEPQLLSYDPWWRLAPESPFIVFPLFLVSLPHLPVGFPGFLPTYTLHLNPCLIDRLCFWGPLAKTGDAVMSSVMIMLCMFKGDSKRGLVIFFCKIVGV